MQTDLLRAIGRLQAKRGDGGQENGTAFFVGDRYLLTAFHCVGDRKVTIARGEEQLYPELTFFTNQGKKLSVHVIVGCCDAIDDWALLEVTKTEENGTASNPLGDITPIPLGEISQWELDKLKKQGKDVKFECWGYPRLADMTDSGTMLDGRVLNCNGEYQKSWTYELYSDQAAAGFGDPLNGLSGAPVIIDGAAVGIIRSNLVLDDQVVGRSRHVVQGKVYACPIAAQTLQIRCSRNLRLLDPVRGLPGLPRQDLPPKPFTYLHWYGSSHSEVFFGRNQKIRELYVKVTDQDAPRVTLVYGASGTGKSSLLEAGLLPRLSREQFVLEKKRYTISRPLADTLDEQIVAADLTNDLNSAPKPIVILLDQIESVFTNPTWDGNAQVKALGYRINAALVSNNTLRIILGFRSEWLANVRKCLQECGTGFGELYIERLTRDEIEEVVRGVASTKRLQSFYNVDIDPDLPRRIADDLVADPRSSVSPILSIIMTRLYDQMGQDRRLSKNSYDTQMRSKLDLTAFLNEQIQLVGKTHGNDVRLGLVHDVLFRHTTDDGTAKEVPWSELCKTYSHLAQEEDNSRLRGLLNALAANALIYSVDSIVSTQAVTQNFDGGTRLAHDVLAALIRRGYENSELPGQRARRILESRVKESETGLLDRAALEVVTLGYSGMRAWTDAEDSLIADSEVHIASIRETREAEIRRHRSVRWIAASGLCTFLIVAGLTVVLWWQKGQAERVAQGRQMVYESKIPENDGERALGLAVNAWRTMPGLDSYEALFSAVYRNSRLKRRQLASDEKWVRWGPTFLPQANYLYWFDKEVQKYLALPMLQLFSSQDIKRAIPLNISTETILTDDGTAIYQWDALTCALSKFDLSEMKQLWSVVGTDPCPRQPIANADSSYFILRDAKSIRMIAANSGFTIWERRLGVFPQLDGADQIIVDRSGTLFAAQAGTQRGLWILNLSSGKELQFPEIQGKPVLLAQPSQSEFIAVTAQSGDEKSKKSKEYDLLVNVWAFPNESKVEQRCSISVKVSDKASLDAKNALIADPVVLDPSGWYAGAWALTGELQLCNLAGRDKKIKARFRPPISDITFSSDGSLLAVADVDQFTVLQLPQDSLVIGEGKIIGHRSVGRRHPIQKARFFEDNQSIVTFSSDGAIHKWQIQPEHLVGSTIHVHRGSPDAGVSALRFLRNDTLLASGTDQGEKGSFRISDITTSKLIGADECKLGVVRDFEEVSHGKVWMRTTRGTSLVLEDAAPQEGSIRPCKPVRNTIGGLSGGNELFVDFNKARFKTLKVDGTEVSDFGLPRKAGYSLFKIITEPNSNLFAVVITSDHAEKHLGNEGLVRSRIPFFSGPDIPPVFWDAYLAPANVISENPVISQIVSAVNGRVEGECVGIGREGTAFLPRLNLLLGTDLDGNVLVCKWKDGVGSSQRLPSAHSGRATAVAASTDGQYFASGTENGEIVLWKDSKPIVIMPDAHFLRISKLEFSGSGKMLASGDDSGQVKLWRLDSEFLVKRACEILNPPRPDEC